MTDEQLIRQLEQALAALKAGDESALDRLSALVGDIVGGDRITIGASAVRPLWQLAVTSAFR